MNPRFRFVFLKPTVALQYTPRQRVPRPGSGPSGWRPAPTGRARVRPANLGGVSPQAPAPAPIRRARAPGLRDRPAHRPRPPRTDGERREAETSPPSPLLKFQRPPFAAPGCGSFSRRPPNRGGFESRARAAKRAEEEREGGGESAGSAPAVSARWQISATCAGACGGCAPAQPGAPRAAWSQPGKAGSSGTAQLALRGGELGGSGGREASSWPPALRRRPGRPESLRAPYTPPGGAGDTAGAADATAAAAGMSQPQALGAGPVTQESAPGLRTGRGRWPFGRDRVVEGWWRGGRQL